MRRSLPLLLVCTLLACGRDPLLVTGPVDGSAGAGGAASGVGGDTGDGGTDLCRLLAPPQTTIALAGANDFHSERPVLVASAAQRGLVTLASSWTAVSGSPAGAQLRHVSFAPWLSWPPGDMGPSLLADLDRGASFAMTAADGERFGLLVSDGGNPQAPDGAFFSDRFEPGSTDIKVLTPIDADAKRVLFAERSDDWYLLGTERLGLNHQSVVTPVQTFGGGGVAQLATLPIGCAGSLLAIDAAATPDGWLVAASSNIAAPDPCSFTSSIGPAGVVLLASVSRSAEITSLAPFFSGFPLLTLDLVAAADGAWLSYITDEPNLPIYLVGLSAAGEVRTNLQLSSLSQGNMAIAPLGDLLAIAYVRSSKRIEVELRDAQGTLLSTESLRAPADITGTVTGPISLLASPDERALLLAWSEDDGAQLVHVTRFDCLL